VQITNSSTQLIPLAKINIAQCKDCNVLKTNAISDRQRNLLPSSSAYAFENQTVAHYSVIQNKLTGLKASEYGNEGNIWGRNPKVVEEFRKG
jgi:hypothetical protein